MNGRGKTTLCSTGCPGHAVVMATTHTITHTDLQIDPRRAAELAATHDVDEAVRSVLPWVGFLPERDQVTWVTEIQRKLAAGASFSSFDRLQHAVDRWEGTAEAYNLGFTPEEDLEWLDDPTPVKRPEQGELMGKARGPVPRPVRREPVAVVPRLQPVASAAFVPGGTRRAGRAVRGDGGGAGEAGEEAGGRRVRVRCVRRDGFRGR